MFAQLVVCLEKVLGHCEYADGSACWNLSTEAEVEAHMRPPRSVSLSVKVRITQGETTYQRAAHLPVKAPFRAEALRKELERAVGLLREAVLDAIREGELKGPKFREAPEVGDCINVSFDDETVKAKVLKVNEGSALVQYGVFVFAVDLSEEAETPS